MLVGISKCAVVVVRLDVERTVQCTDGTCAIPDQHTHLHADKPVSSSDDSSLSSDSDSDSDNESDSDSDSDSDSSDDDSEIESDSETTGVPVVKRISAAAVDANAHSWAGRMNLG